MPPRAKPETATQSDDDAKFKAVVKRLLDTPPMHKTGKAPTKAKERPASKGRAHKGKTT